MGNPVSPRVLQTMLGFQLPCTKALQEEGEQANARIET